MKQYDCTFFFFILKVDNLKFKSYFRKEEPPYSSYKPQLDIQVIFNCFVLMLAFQYLN